MKFSTWEAIAKRHVPYRDLLIEKMAEWPEARIVACHDMRTLQSVVKLSERVERHHVRMARHLERALVAIPAQGKA